MVVVVVVVLIVVAGGGVVVVVAAAAVVVVVVVIVVVVVVNSSQRTLSLKVYGPPPKRSLKRGTLELKSLDPGIALTSGPTVNRVQH